MVIDLLPPSGQRSPNGATGHDHCAACSPDSPPIARLDPVDPKLARLLAELRRHSGRLDGSRVPVFHYRARQRTVRPTHSDRAPWTWTYALHRSVSKVQTGQNESSGVQHHYGKLSTRLAALSEPEACV